MGERFDADLDAQGFEAKDETSLNGARVAAIEVAVLGAPSRPSGLGQRSTQERTALAGRAATALARALVLARAHPRPRGQVPVGREPRHVGPDLGHDRLGGPSSDPGYRVEPAD